MAELTYEVMIKRVAEKALDEFLYDGRSIKEWIQIIASEDCISRQTVIDVLKDKWNMFSNADDAMQESIDTIEALPPVNSQDPKAGRWIKTPRTVMGEGYMWYCDKCEYQVYQDSSRDYPSEKYCPNCGNKKDKPQEREASE